MIGERRCRAARPDGFEIDGIMDTLSEDQGILVSAPKRTISPTKDVPQLGGKTRMSLRSLAQEIHPVLHEQSGTENEKAEFKKKNAHKVEENLSEAQLRNDAEATQQTIQESREIFQILEKKRCSAFHFFRQLIQAD